MHGKTICRHRFANVLKNIFNKILCNDERMHNLNPEKKLKLFFEKF